MCKIVFLDRDGLINQSAAHHDYVKKIDEFQLLPNVAASIRRLNEAGFIVVVITNQRGVARGMMSLSDVDDIHRYMIRILRAENAKVDNIFVCPHEIGECHCRKPDIGLFLQAEKCYTIDKANSWMVGDSQSDEDAGTSYGIRTIRTGNLMAAVDTILFHDSNQQD